MKVELNNVMYEVFFSRRRYGTRTYTWVDSFKSPDGIYIGPKDDLSDPFSAVTPKISDLVQLLKEWLEDGLKWVYNKGERTFIQ